MQNEESFPRQTEGYRSRRENQEAKQKTTPLGKSNCGIPFSSSPYRVQAVRPASKAADLGLKVTIRKGCIASASHKAGRYCQVRLAGIPLVQIYSLAPLSPPLPAPIDLIAKENHFTRSTTWGRSGEAELR